MNTVLIIQDGRTALHIACEKQFVNVAELLITNGADLNIIDKVLYSLLMAADPSNNEYCAHNSGRTYCSAYRM
jgi:ankyrin repeat protein